MSHLPGMSHLPATIPGGGGGGGVVCGMPSPFVAHLESISLGTRLGEHATAALGLGQTKQAGRNATFVINMIAVL